MSEEKPQEEKKKEISSEDYWRKLVKKEPGCLKNGICNECGLCEH